MIGANRPTWARAAGRVSGRMVRRNRYVDASLEAGRTTLRATNRALRSLLLQITGTFFVVFSGVGAGAAIREYQTGSGAGRISVVALFTVICIYFAITSFLRSRDLSR